MFKEALSLITSDLRAFIASTDSGGAAEDAPEYIVSGNIALFDGAEPNATISQRMVATVINIAEESAFKNAPHFERNGNQTRYRNAPAFLNLYILFSANYVKYETALKRLSQVVTFFQGKNVFDLKNTPQLDMHSDPTELRLIVELFALTFEQVNYVWASLGGKQMPFVLYKVRMVRVQADRTQAEGHVIEEIVGNSKNLTAIR